MPSLIAYRPIRLLCDLAQPNHVREQRTGLPPAISRGSPTVIQVALAIGRVVCTDVSQIAASITLEIRDAADASLPSLVSKTIAAAEFDDTLTQAAWDAKAGQHAAFALSALEMELEPGEKWITVRFAPVAGPSVVAAFGKVNVRDDGAAGAPEGDAWTAAEHAARYLPAARDGVGMKRGTVTIAPDAETVAIAFATPFGAAPAFVRVWAIKPDAAGANFFAVVRGDTISAAGFIAELSGPLPANHELGWIACL